MDQHRDSPFRVGSWLADPLTCQISRDGESIRLDARVMRLLQCLARRAGAVVSTEELLEEVWPGVVVTQDSVYQAVASLRRALADDPRRPTYVVTVPRLGYRLVAHVGEVAAGPEALPVAPVPAVPVVSPEPPKPAVRRRRLLWIGAGALPLLGALLVIGVMTLAPDASRDPAAEKCVAVLPFRDMTDAMDEEPFADGMTAQLIDTLSKIPGSHVPSLTSSLYFKGKQTTIAAVAHKLGVAYVLEGSVRKSGNTLRITAQLTRADDGYVVWSNSYDRPTTDVLMVQSDIASQVRHALEASLQARSPSAAARATPRS